MKAKKIVSNLVILIITSIIYTLPLLAQHDHSAHEHKAQTEEVQDHSNHDHGDVQENIEKSLKADLEEFPSLHPLVVHFPIVLLIIAALIQSINLYTRNRAIDVIIITLLLIGFVGAYMATSLVHPHAGEIAEHVQEILTLHENYASWTVWLSMGAFIVKTNAYIFNQKRWLEFTCTLLLLGSAYAVSEAGHYGAQLTHIENVEIESHETHDNHQH